MLLWAKCQHRRREGLRFSTDSCRVIYCTLIRFSPPSALWNNRTCFDKGRIEKKNRFKGWPDEEVREHIHSASSATVTIYFEEAYSFLSTPKIKDKHMEKKSASCCQPKTTALLN